MGDSKNIPTESMRDRLLQAARTLFGEYGFDGTSLQAVANRVGIAKPSLLYHFRSKNVLREAVLEDLLAHWNRELPKLLASARSGEDRFASMFGALVSFFEEDPSRSRLVARAMLDQPDLVRSLLQTHVAPWTGLLCDYIRMGQDSGSIRKEVNPEAWVAQMVTMVVGTIAMGDVAHALLPAGSPAPSREELTRIARDSLFETYASEE